MCQACWATSFPKVKDQGPGPSAPKKPAFKVAGREAGTPTAKVNGGTAPVKAQSGARYFPIGEVDDSQAGDTGDPPEDGIAVCEAEIARVTTVLKCLEGSEAEDNPFLVQYRARKKEFEEQLLTLRKEKRKEVPTQIQLDRLCRAQRKSQAKMDRTKGRMATAVEEKDAAEAKIHELAGVYSNQKEVHARISREIDSLHQEHVPFEDISSE